MLIKIPSPNSEGGSWSGTLHPPTATKERWKFECVRTVEPSQMYASDPFGDTETVVGLLDYQTPCTLYQPMVLTTNPGSLGINYQELRTRISGEFSALLTNIQVTDPNERMFDGCKFESEVLNVWHDRQSFKTTWEYTKRKHDIEIADNEELEISKIQLGRVTTTVYTAITGPSNFISVQTKTMFRIECSEPASLATLYSHCIGLEKLFCFLVGWSPKPPIFSLAPIEKVQLTTTEMTNWCPLEVSGQDWSENPAPNWSKTIHRQGKGGGTLEGILSSYYADQESLVMRINVLDFCRHFTSNLNDKFAMIMPCFEEFVGSRYAMPDEADFMAHQDRFFGVIDGTDDLELIEFSKKHVRIVRSKAPSLKGLIARSIEFANSRGFNFSALLSDRISRRRGKLFHAVARLASAEVYEFQEEIHAIMALLTIHTLIDLGIDPAYLNGEPSPPHYLSPFLAKKNEPEAN